jgi:ethanolamine utilization microcompartment shell protein EutL
MFAARICIVTLVVALTCLDMSGTAFVAAAGGMDTFLDSSVVTARVTDVVSTGRSAVGKMYFASATEDTTTEMTPRELQAGGAFFKALTATEVLLILAGGVAVEVIFLGLYLQRTKNTKPEEAVNRFETRPIQAHNWDAIRDKKTGMFYFVNKQTGASQWEPPAGFREV